MSTLDVRGVTVRYGELTLLDDVSFTAREGEWLMICGPNGAGKSTLVGAVSQGVPYTGEVLYDGEDLSLMKPVQIAQRIGVLTQSNNVGYAFTVEEVVRLGRYAHSGGFFGDKRDGAEDEARVRDALEQTGLVPFAQHSVLVLSGGELQRTFLAQVFAQNPRTLILDEPTNHLDLMYQKRMFDMLRAWLAEPGRSIVSVTHDLNLAKAYGTTALLLDRGHVVAMGPPAEALAPEALARVYGMDVSGWMRELLGLWGA